MVGGMHGHYHHFHSTFADSQCRDNTWVCAGPVAVLTNDGRQLVVSLCAVHASLAEAMHHMLVPWLSWGAAQRVTVVIYRSKQASACDKASCFTEVGSGCSTVISLHI
jgi:hypothetical protein